MNVSPQDRLDSGQIRAGMAPELSARLSQLNVLEEIDSTNTQVLRVPGERQHAYAVLAERQTRGRGRRHRNWHSPAGGNIYLSLGWWFRDSRWPLSTLPLIAALAVSRALARAGLHGHGIKWPNDILVNDKKLAGILVELQSAGNGPALAVMGIGLNVRMPAADPEQLAGVIDRPWTDLASQLDDGAGEVSRNLIAAGILEELLVALECFEASGFEPFLEDWNKLDLLRGRNIELDHHDRTLKGVAKGVDGNGGLLLQTGDSDVRVFHSGEVSVHRD